MDKLTLDEALKLHRQLWEGVAKRISDDTFGYYLLGELKDAALKEMNIKREEVDDACFMCQYVADIVDINDIDCSNGVDCNYYCPLKWSDCEEENVCYRGETPYKKLLRYMELATYGEYEDFEEDERKKLILKARKLALEIANLPVKEGYDGLKTICD